MIRNKYFLFPAASLGSLLLLGVLINIHVVCFSSQYIVSMDNLSEYDAVMVLGAQVKSGGRVSNILYDRLRTAFDIYQKHPELKILVTGDNGSLYYDEVNTMKDFLISKDIDPYYIFMDHAGFNTYDSAYRAKAVYKIDRMLISTQKYHLYRAVYNSRRMGIEAYGIPADRREYVKINYFRLREAAARIKDFFLVNIFKPGPVYTGKSFPISGDGRETVERPDMPLR